MLTDSLLFTVQASAEIIVRYKELAIAGTFLTKSMLRVSQYFMFIKMVHVLAMYINVFQGLATLLMSHKNYRDTIVPVGSSASLLR